MTPAPPILVAGVGNVFLGDDAFGVEVVRRLGQRKPRPDVRIEDFGIRAFDLLMALERCEAAILIDVVRRGGEPGTLYVVEALGSSACEVPSGVESVDPHAIDATRVVRSVLATAAGKEVLVVGCEPESFGDEEEGRLGLSAKVEAAVDGAVELVDILVGKLVERVPRA